MDNVLFQSVSDEVKDTLESYILNGNTEEYISCVEGIAGPLCKLVYHAGLKLYLDAMYKDAMRAFKAVAYLTDSSNYKRLAVVRWCLCLLKIGDEYMADICYREMSAPSIVGITTKRHECEFYFLLAEYALERNKDLREVVMFIDKGFNAGQDAGFYCAGFITTIQTARELAKKARKYDLDYKLTLIINRIKSSGKLTEEQLAYLNEMENT